MTDYKPIYYVRFLKPPPTACLIGQQFTIVWTIENDLGDQTYWEPVPVTISVEGSSRLGLRELNADPKSNSKKKAIALAKPYMPPQKVSFAQSLPIVFDPVRGGGIVTKLVIEQLPGQPLASDSLVDLQLSLTLSPAVRTGQHGVWTGAHVFQDQIWVVPTWSEPLVGSVGKQRHVQAAPSGDQAERILRVNDSKVLRIREDAVQSIARHVWDCGLGMCQYLSEQKTKSKHKILLELGSGTGLVGIYAAELLQPKRVYLTDLDDALEIMQQNVDLIKNTAVDLQVKELSWGPEKNQDYEDVDLILLTDVLYNQSSHDLLLDTLDWLLDNSQSKALLAYKERNPDEREFFTKVSSRGWKCTQVENIDHLVCEIYWISKH